MLDFKGEIMYNNNKDSLRCDCGKIIAKQRDGKIYLWCKHCKKEIELNIETEPLSR